MEKNYPLSPNDEPPKANITSAELITFQPLERNSVIYEDIPLPTALNVDEQGSPPLSSTLDASTSSAYASISPPGTTEQLTGKDISYVNHRYDEATLRPQNVSTYPVVLTAINVNEFQVSANTKTSHCNNRLKSFVEYDGVICQIDKVTQEPKDEILNCVLSFTEEREVYDLDRCQSFYVIHVKTSISEADVIIPKEQLDTLYSVLKKRFPEISFNADCGKAKELFKQYIAERYIQDKAAMKSTKANKYPGWGKAFEAKKFHPGQNEDGDTLLTLPNVDQNHRYNLYDYGLKLLKLAPFEVVLPLFLHAHSGFVRKLFQEG